MNWKIAFSESRSPSGTRIWDLKGKILVIAEKPKAARKIAEALSPRPLIKRVNEVTLYEIQGKGQTIIVASSVGHLYELYTRARNYPVFEYEWVPAYIVNEDKAYTKKYLLVLKEMCKLCDYYVNACDYDIEGSVIGYMIIKFNGDERRAFRVKFSSLTPQELRTSFDKLSSLDYNMIEAGMCRHELDWIWGINVSRALMSAVNNYVNSGNKLILSAGRVQTPLLKYVVDVYIERNLFIPVPQYVVKVVVEKNGKRMELEYVGNPVERKDIALKIVENVKKQGYLILEKYEKSRREINPPPPFNLGDLQEEAAKIYGFSPSKTQEIAEQLYLDALISYPRTNSQKLPSTLNYRDIIEKLKQIPSYEKLVQKLLKETMGVLRPVEGEKDDPAHPAIYPTGVIPGKLNRDQWLIYDLITRRFLAAFSTPLVISSVKMILRTPSGDQRFLATGQVIEHEGWLSYYPFHTIKSRELPSLREGERLLVVDVKARETYTKPPQRLKKIDMLRWMENVEIGTESTRAQIIEKLFERGYLTQSRNGVDVTDLGYGVIEILEEFFPDLTSVNLTRKFEKLMIDIRNGVKKKHEVIDEAKVVLNDLIKRFDANKEKIGLRLASRLGIIEPVDKCVIKGCMRDNYSNGLCKYHYMARENVRKIYEEWSKRKRVSFNEYLVFIKRSRLVGKWVKEIVMENLY
ncbi:MAG: DNA topoisomerase I [Desulfurococcaceae archaeon]